MTAGPGRAGSSRLLPHVVFLVARREILLRLRSRVFILGTVGMVAVVVIGVIAGSRLGGSSATTSQPAAVRVAFRGGAQALEPAFRSTATALEQTIKLTEIADPAEGRAQVAAGTLDMVVSGSATEPTALVSDSVPGMVEIALDAAAQTARLSAAGLPPASIASVMAGVPFELVHPADSAGSKRTPNLVAALGVAIMLMITLALYGSLVAHGVVEEKATRIIEILLATVPPSGLLAGKILGIGLVGLVQVSIVAAAALVAVSATHLVSIPALGVVPVLGYLTWFLLGFLLYATAYAAVAALVSRPEEVQGSVTPISLFLAVAYLLVFVALPNPSAPIVTLFSMLPPFAPILMSVRTASSDVAIWQVGLALALMIVSIPALTWFAGRIYTHSVLRTGARVPLVEAWRGR